MLYVTFETMEDEETTILAEKSTILDGRRRRRQENVELKPPQPPSWGWSSGWGLSSAIHPKNMGMYKTYKKRTTVLKNRGFLRNPAD